MSNFIVSILKTLCYRRNSCKIVFFLLLTIAVLTETGYASTSKNVLILNSGNSRDYTSNLLVNTISYQFIQFAPFTNFYIEDLNFEAFTDEVYYQILKDFLVKKYSKRKFSAILTIDRDALKFVLKYRDTFFKGIPIVFFGVGMEYKDILIGQKNITGIVTEADFTNTVKLALNLHPNRNNLIILSDSTLSSIAALSKFKTSVSSFSNSMEFIYLKNIKSLELVQTVKPYETSGILFLLGSTFLKPGVLVTSENLSNMISKKLEIPAYTFGKGVLDNKIGGSFINLVVPAKMAAGIVIKVLKGKDISEFPVMVFNDPKYTFNYEQLTRFKVDLNKLPPNSKIRGKPLPFLEQYKSELYFVLQTVIAFIVISILLFNIYKRKKTEKALKASEERFKGLYENAPIGLYRTTPEGKILMVNPAMVKTLGYSSIDEIFKVNLAEDHKKAGYNRDLFKKEIEKNGYVRDYQDTWVKKNGEIIHLMENARLFRDNKGKPLYYEGMIADITEKKIAEDELRHYISELQKNKQIIENDARKLEELNLVLAESEKKLIELNKSKDKFFSMLSHDLRSPFNSLIGFTDLLIKNFDELSSDEVKTISQNIHSSLTHLYELIDNILQWSGLQTGKISHNPEIIDLRKIVDQVLILLNGSAVKKLIKLSNTTPEKQYAFADRLMLFSVLQNLISNALKFTNSGGEICIMTQEDTAFHVIIVADNGVGMTPDELEQIFRIDSSLSRSGTLGEKGTGLGLILCKELTEKNGGKIRVESTFGKGTSFIFTVPKFIQ